MSLLATSTATIERPDADGDPYEAAAVVTVASQVPAHLSEPTAEARTVGGSKETIDAVVYLPAGQDVTRYDIITLDGTEQYQALWVVGRSGLGLAYTSVGVRRSAGQAAA